MNAFWRGFDAVLNGMLVVAGVILVFTTAAVCYGIAMRFFFRSPSIWVAQATEYALLWMVFLGTTWLLREKGHVSADIIYGNLNDRAKRWLDLVMYAAAGVACGVLVVFSASYVWECIVRGVTDVRAVTIPKWTVFWIIPVGMAFLTLQFFRIVCQRYRSLREGR
ncbi:MAG: TRAP transporter small permease subunit [Thermodesulfobacteriota bacterium]